ncbi:hypothetical protein [Stieleria varia]|nr:hypothetical protein [Stieleria varia]
MAHTALAVAEGESGPGDIVGEMFNMLQNTRLSQLEDPAENVMTAPVIFQDRSFLLLNGIWESNISTLQRFLTVVETMQDDDGFETLKHCIRSLLTLVDESCRRSGIERYAIGKTTPVDFIEPDELRHRQDAAFTRDDLDALGVDPAFLRPFIVRKEWVPAQANTLTSKSVLHRYPIIQDQDRFVLAMPASAPIAIREFLIDTAVGNGFVDELAGRLARSTVELVSKERVFGIPPDHPFPFVSTGAGPMSECASVLDSGEVIQFLFLADDLADIEMTSSVGRRPLGATASQEIASRIQNCSSQFSDSERFDFGLTLIVDCGVGRTIEFPDIDFDHSEWAVEYCSIEDLIHLDRISEFDSVDLIKILQGKRKAEELGVRFHNPQGIANLVAWVRANDGHVVRSQDLPKEFRNKEFSVFIAPSFVQELRAESARSCDIRGAYRVDGSTQLVRVFAKHHFEEDGFRETYAPVDFDRSNPSVIYISGSHSWWFTLESAQPTAMTYERIEMLRTWLGRMGQAIARLATITGIRATEVRFRFHDRMEQNGFLPPEALPTTEEIESEISVSCDIASRVVTLEVGEKFEVGTAAPTNVSELALVRQILRGVSRLPGMPFSEDQVTELADTITGGPDGRHLHGLLERTYRDRFGFSIRGKVTTPTTIDNCNLRLGLAFNVESKGKGRAKLRAKRTCTELLNNAVTYLEDELCRQLRRFDRLEVIRKTLTNYEAALFQRERWERTAHANVAIHDDKPAALNTIVQQVGQLDGVIQPSRLLVEVAVCECPKSGGMRLGTSDLSRLLTIVNAICTLGGWSDAIHRNAMPPELEITPLGDILADTKFEREVLSPFHSIATEDRVDNAIETREKIYASSRPNVTPDAPEFDPLFRSAIQAELQLEIEDAVFLTDKVYELGFHRNELMFEISRSDFQEKLAEGRSPEIAKRLVEAFTFPMRDGYRNIGGDQDVRNIQLWRLRRTLSVLRRPIIEVTPDNLLVSPDMVRTSVFYVLGAFYEGTYRERDLESKEMRDWKSRTNNRRGTKFAERVAKKLTELGWVTAMGKRPWIEVQMTEILADKSGKAFGDVDVVAFDPNSGRVLCIECKALHFHKTHGEVAEQLSDYRGELNSKDKPDDLLKHLNRIELLRKNTDKIAKFVRSKSDIVIEPLLVFENPVPMLFAWKGRMKQNEIATFSSLADRYAISRNDTTHEGYQDRN